MDPIARRHIDMAVQELLYDYEVEIDEIQESLRYAITRLDATESV